VDLTRLLFGTPDTINPGNGNYLVEAPKPKPDSRLAAAIERAFPLPALEYGLNFT